MFGSKYLGADLKDLPETPPDKKASHKEESQDNDTEVFSGGTPDKGLDLKADNLKPNKEIKYQTPEVKKKARTYKHKKYASLSFTLNVGRANNLLAIDPETGQERAIRHCPNTKTIWLDEQNNDIAVVEPIVFIRGFYKAEAHEEYTQRFLEVHPGNGKKFEQVDKEKDASVTVNLEDKKIDIKQAIRERMTTGQGIEEVRAIVAVLDSDVVGAAKMTPSEIRYAAYMCVENNPTRFLNDHGEINIFEDSTIKRTALAQHAFIAGVIQVSPNGRQVIWASSKKPICAVPQGLNYLNVFVNFLATEEGILVAQELSV
jgi:hypothetical protein